jgi:hypothetical protein
MRNLALSEVMRMIDYAVYDIVHPNAAKVPGVPDCVGRTLADL